MPKIEVKSGDLRDALEIIVPKKKKTLSNGSCTNILVLSIGPLNLTIWQTSVFFRLRSPK